MKRSIIPAFQGVPVTIIDDRTGYQYPGMAHHYGRADMYLEADYAPRPGSTCHIRLEHHPQQAGDGVHASMIQWRRAVCEPDAIWSFRLGIKNI